MYKRQLYVCVVKLSMTTQTDVISLRHIGVSTGSTSYTLSAAAAAAAAAAAGGGGGGDITGPLAQ